MNVQKSVDILWQIYQQKFGGKKEGRFKLKRSDVAGLLGCQKLHDHVLRELTDECLKRGLLFSEGGKEGNFYVLEQKKVRNFRTVPKRLIERFSIKRSDR